jgi:hypothetical protein
MFSILLLECRAHTLSVGGPLGVPVTDEVYLVNSAFEWLLLSFHDILHFLNLMRPPIEAVMHERAMFVFSV